MSLKAGYKGIKNNLLNKIKAMPFISTIGDGLTLEDGELSATGGGGGGADLSVIAPAFSTETAYTAGEYVTYDGKLYKFTNDHAAGAWSTSDVTEITVSDDLEKTYKIDDSTESAIVDGDYVPFFDSSAASGAGAPRKSTWSNFKSKLKSYFDTLYFSGKYIEGDTPTTSSGIDTFVISDEQITLSSKILSIVSDVESAIYNTILLSEGSITITYDHTYGVTTVGFLIL